MQPLLANAGAQAGAGRHRLHARRLPRPAAHPRQLALFRLRSAADIKQRLRFPNTGPDAGAGGHRRATSTATDSPARASASCCTWSTSLPTSQALLVLPQAGKHWPPASGAPARRGRRSRARATVGDVRRRHRPLHRAGAHRTRYVGCMPNEAGHDTLLLFGATGDLSQRYLFPSLVHLLRDRLLPPDFQVVAIGRQEHRRRRLPAWLRGRARPTRPRAIARRSSELLSRTHYRSVDLRRQRGDGARGCRATPTSPASVTWRFRRTCSCRPAKACRPPACWPRRRDWCWKSRSATTSRRRARSMRRCAASSTSRGSSASTITWARRRCRTCSRCASATR